MRRCTMMKKLLLGIAVCCGVSGVNGMNVAPSVDGVVSNPSDRSALTQLVSEVFKSNQKTLQARNYIYSKIDQSEEELTSKTLQLYRICSMLYQLSRDIRTCGVDSVSDYVDGAIKGSFGPYSD